MMTYTINKLDKCIILHVYVLYVHLVCVHSIYMCVIMLVNTGLRINQTLGIGKWVWIIGWVEVYLALRMQVPFRLVN